MQRSAQQRLAAGFEISCCSHLGSTPKTPSLLPPSPHARPQMDGVQAALTPDDVLECEAVLKRNPRFRAIMAQRYGISDVDTELAVDPWWGCTCRQWMLL